MANTIKMDRGTTTTINFQYKRNGEPTSLIGHIVRFTIKADEYDDATDDSTALVAKTLTTGDDSGRAVIIINPADTETLEKGKYFFDLKVETPDRKIYKVNEGVVKLDASPTNRRGA